MEVTIDKKKVAIARIIDLKQKKMIIIFGKGLGQICQITGDAYKPITDFTEEELIKIIEA